MCLVNEVVVVVLNTILAEAVLQLLGKSVDLTLGLIKCLTIVAAVLLAFLGLEY